MRTMPTNVDYYEILGVATDATIEDIKRAHKAQVRKTHPDVGGSAALFRMVQEAYDTLSDPDERARYDRQRSAGGPQPDPEPEPAASHNGHAGSHNEPHSHQPPPAGGGPSWFGQQQAATTSRATVYGTAPDNTYEAVTAAGINAVPLPDHTFVFHRPTVGNQPVSHVIAAGARMLLIQVVTWPPGTYFTDPATGQTFHDGRRFNDGTVQMAQACEKLVERIGWPAGWDRILVVAPSGPPPDLSHYFTPAFTTMHLDQLPAWLAGWWAAGADGADDGFISYTRIDPLVRLRAAVKQPVQSSVIPDPVPVPDGALSPRDVADPASAVGRAVTIAAGVAFAAAAAVGLAGYNLTAPPTWLSTVAVALTVVGLAAGAISERTVTLGEFTHDLRAAAGMPTTRAPGGPWWRPTWQIALPAAAIASLWEGLVRYAADADITSAAGTLGGLALVVLVAFPAVRHLRRAAGVTIGRHTPSGTVKAVNKALMGKPDRLGLVVHALRHHSSHPSAAATLEAIGATGEQGRRFVAHVTHRG